MLLAWEAGDPEVRQLWETMNGWVYAGFEETYKKLGVSFDKIYYESETYLLGKDVVLEGLEKGIFYRQEDGSVWVGPDRAIFLAVEDAFFKTFQNHVLAKQVGFRFVIDFVKTDTQLFVGFFKTSVHPTVH